MSSRPFLIVLTGLLLGLNAFANDIMLPAFFDIARDLVVPLEAVQGLVPLFLIAAGLGQLVSGPVSDRFGRRPVMVVGLALFIAGSVICASSTSILGLQVGRMVQGFGSAFGVVMARATLRDTHTGVMLARTMALTAMIFALGPIAAPLVGVGLMAVSGWRAAFICVGLVAAGLAALVIWVHRETLAEPNPLALEPRRLFAAFKAVVVHPQSRRYLVVACLQQALIILMVANSSRLFKSQFNIDGVTFALLFGASAIGIIAGQVINYRVIARLGVFRANILASSLVTVVMAAIALVTWAGWMTPVLFVIGLALFEMGFLVVLSNAAALVLEPHHKIAGVTASFFGCATQVTGSTIALATFGIIGGAMLPWALAMTLVSAVVLAILLATGPVKPVEAAVA